MTGIPDNPNGALIRSIYVSADYKILLVGTDINGLNRYQAVALEQLTHRLWRMPMTAADINREFQDGLITFLENSDDNN